VAYFFGPPYSAKTTTHTGMTFRCIVKNYRDW